MAEIVRYVNTASTLGGDGTTNATTGDNRAYASLSEWEADEQTDLDTANNTHLVHCEGSAADVAATIDGWTTSVTDFITVQVDTDKRHDGKWNAGKYRIEADGAVALQLADHNVFVIGLQLKGDNLSGGIFLISRSNVIRECIVTGSSRYGFYLTGDDNNRLYNCLAFEVGRYGFYDSKNGGNTYLYNCTSADNGRHNFYHGEFGVTEQYTNCLGYNPGATYSDFTGTPSITTCASSDATGSAGLQSIADPFEDAANDDYHLASDASIIGDGTDLSGTFTVDIDNETRVAWDIGADEYAAAGPTEVTKDGALTSSGAIGRKFEGNRTLSGEL